MKTLVKKIVLFEPLTILKNMAIIKKSKRIDHKTFNKLLILVMPNKYNLLCYYIKHSQRFWDRWSVTTKILCAYAVCCAFLYFGAYTAKAGTINHNKLEQIEAEINLLKQKGAKIGCQMVCSENGKIIYSYNQNEPLIPASNLKLITTAASLIRLGVNYRFKTVIYTADPPVNSVINGDIYIKGFGDPFLVNEYMWILTNELKILGLKKITGDIIADETFFNLNENINISDTSTSSYWYDSEIGALSFNFNTASVFLKPGPKPGDKAIARLDPDISHIKLKNEAITCDKARNKDIYVSRDFLGEINLITVKGNIPFGSQPVKIYRTVKGPAIYTAMAFKSFLIDKGVDFSGKVKIGIVPQGAFPLYIHESKPLGLIILDLNKISNNFIAEQILITMGAELLGPPGTVKKGINVVNETLSNVSIDLTGLEMFDGSGFSSLNRVPARLISDILLFMAKSDNIAPEFMASLAVAGQDGTMKDRKTTGIIRAKTGRIQGVSALSGYLWTIKGNPIIFSIIMNGSKSQMDDFLKSQDKILSIMYTINDICQ